MAEHNPWAFSTGLPDGGHGKVTDAHFDYNEDGDRVFAFLNIQFDDPDIGEGGAYEARVPVGGDEEWEVIDKGSKIRNRKSATKTLNRNSGLATLCTTALMQGIDLQARGDGTPYDASIWKGVEGDFLRYDFENTNRRTKEKMEWSWLLFDVGGAENIGGSCVRTAADSVVDDGDAKPAAKDTKAKASTSTSKGGKAKAAAATDADATDTTAETPATPANGATPDGLNAVLAAKLKVLANKCSTHPEFMEQAFATYPEINGDNAAEIAVALDGEGGIWHAVKG